MKVFTSHSNANQTLVKNVYTLFDIVLDHRRNHTQKVQTCERESTVKKYQ